MIENNIVIHTFMGEKAGRFFSKKLEVRFMSVTNKITFGRTEDDDEYVMIIKEGDDEDFISIENVEYIRVIEDKPNAYEICYLVTI